MKIDTGWTGMRDRCGATVRIAGITSRCTKSADHWLSHRFDDVFVRCGATITLGGSMKHRCELEIGHCNWENNHHRAGDIQW